MGPAPSNPSSSTSSQYSAPAPVTTGGNGTVSVGFQPISKAGNITVSIGSTTAKDGNTIITFPDGSTATTANPNPPDPPISIPGYGVTGKNGYSVVTLFTLSLK